MTPQPLPTDDQWRRWGIDPAWSRMLDIAGHRWHVLERAPSAPLGTIVCVHGNPTWSYLWRDLLVRLGARYRVVAVDQLGMGFSERVGPRAYGERVADLTAVVDALSIDEPFVLIGHDWGGAISMGYAVDHPERLRGLVLCNTGIAVPAGRKAPSLIRLAASGPITDLVGRRTRTFVEGTLMLSGKRLTSATRDALRAPYRSAARRRSIAGFVGDVPFSADDPSAAAIGRVAEALRTLTVPTLLVWGAADPVFDDSFALDLATRLPHADLHRFDGIGHLSPLEADVAGVVDAWISGDAAVAPPLAVAAPASGPYVPTWTALEERADDDTVAFVDGSTGQRTSFRELHRRVNGIACGLAELGLRPGDRVAMLTPPSADLIAAIYGVWRAGGVTVVADRGLGLSGLGRAVRGSRVQWMIGPPAALAVAGTMRWAPGARSVVVGDRLAFGAEITLADLDRSTAALPPEPAGDDPAAVLFTSGATGPAKGVRYRHRQLAAQRDALARTYDITRDDRLVAAFAPFALYGPALGITSTIPDVDVTRPGTLTADALGIAAASIDATIVFASPAALANVLRTGDRPDPRLATVRLVLSAGAPVPVATLRSMGQRCPAAELHTPYGMTECLPVADASLVDIDRAGPGRGVHVGRPVPGAEVMVAMLGFDASTPVSPLPAGVTGEVLVDTPWLSDGYDRRWATERAARPVDTAGRTWHRSGDVGHLDASGALWIEGRSVHVVDTAVGPVTPVPVEVAVERLPGVERAAAVGIGPSGCQQLVVVVEAAGHPGLAGPATTAAVRAAVSDATGAAVAAVLTAPSLPVDVRHNTKIDRTLLADWAGRVLAGDRARVPW